MAWTGRGSTCTPVAYGDGDGGGLGCGRGLGWGEACGGGLLADRRRHSRFGVLGKLAAAIVDLDNASVEPPVGDHGEHGAAAFRAPWHSEADVWDCGHER